MLEIIFYVACTLLAVIGLSEIASVLIIKLTAEKNNNFFVIIPLEDNDEQIEHTLISIYWKLKWSNLSYKKDIVCVDFGINENAKEIFKNMAKEYPALKLVKIEDLNSVLSCMNI